MSRHSPKIVGRRVAGGPRGMSGQAGLNIVDQVMTQHGSSLFEVFSEFDADGNGVLFFTEFVQGMQPLGATPNQIQAVWDAVDVDHAGSVSFDAFFSALAILNKRADKAKWISPFNTVQCENKLIQALRTCRDTVEEAFHVIDVNRNGWISKKEWKECMPLLGIRKGSYSEREITQAWRSLDQNSDGRVNWIEWVNAFRILEGGEAPAGANSPFATGSSRSPSRGNSNSPVASPSKGGGPVASPSKGGGPAKEIHEMTRGELEVECAQHRTTMKQSAKRMDAARKMVLELKAENAQLKSLMR